MKKEELIRRHFHGISDEQWNDLKNQFPYSEIPFIVDHAIKNSLEVYSEDESENVELALLEAIWISRWTKNKQALVAVLEPEEAEQMVKDIHIELAKIGYEIRKKDNF
jgi:hypothetical protein